MTNHHDIFFVWPCAFAMVAFSEMLPRDTMWNAFIGATMVTVIWWAIGLAK